MKVFVITDCQDPSHPAPLAVYSDKREHDARRVNELVKGNLVGPIEINRDIPSDGKLMYRVELTKDGEVRSVDEHSVLNVLQLNLIAGWTVHETRSRWRLKVLVWAKDRAAAETEARMIFVGIDTGKRAKIGVL